MSFMLQICWALCFIFPRKFAWNKKCLLFFSIESIPWSNENMKKLKCICVCVRKWFRTTHKRVLRLAQVRICNIPIFWGKCRTSGPKCICYETSRSNGFEWNPRTSLRGLKRWYRTEERDNRQIHFGNACKSMELFLLQSVFGTHGAQSRLKRQFSISSVANASHVLQRFLIFLVLSTLLRNERVGKLL